MRRSGSISLDADMSEAIVAGLAIPDSSLKILAKGKAYDRSRPRAWVCERERSIEDEAMLRYCR